MSPPVQIEAQLVTEGLYLGPYQVAQDGEMLAKLAINSVMSVLGENQVSVYCLLWFAFIDEFRSPHQDFDKVNADKKVWVQVTDRVEAEEDMKAALPDAVRQLGEWDTPDTVTLVHCQSGG